MEYWLNISWVDIDHLVPVAQAAEQAGFSGLSMGDHLLFPEKLASRYPYSPDGIPTWSAETHWPDNWVAIMAMAAATKTLQFNTGVYIAPLREPYSMAKSISTLSRLTNNRVLVGLGAGWMREEFDIVGHQFEARGRRMDEMIAIMRLLWSGEMVEFHGEFYDLPRSQMSPAPLENVPIYIGGLNEAALRRAVRNEGWVGVHHGMESTINLIGKIRKYEAETSGASGCRILMNGYQFSDEDVAAISDLGVEAICLPLPAAAANSGLEGQLEAIHRAGKELGLSTSG